MNNLSSEQVMNFLFVLVLAILIISNSGEPCNLNTFNPRNWLTIITSLYFVDFLLATMQKNYLRKHLRESACITLCRFFLLVTLVAFYIVGNKDYYNRVGFDEGCGSLFTMAQIMIIFGYIEMMKCCCIGTFICCLIPLIFFAARQQQRPNWMPAPPQFMQNLYTTRYHKPPAAQEEVSCSICLMEYSEADEIIQLPCDERHFFHAPCIKDWLDKNNTCPLCKAPITQEALAA